MKRDIEYILKNLDRIKDSMAKGSIFKSEISAPRRVELCIFEMMAANQYIDHHKVRKWSKHNHHVEPNPTYCRDVCKMWEEEIKAHNREFFKNQTKLF